MKFISILLIQLGCLTSPVVFSQSAKVLTDSEIILLMPKSLKGFQPVSEPTSKLMKIGTLKYSMAEKAFVSGKRKIKILLFDYVEAPIMYSQSTRKFSSFSEVESDSLTLRSLVVEGGRGWETFNNKNASSQISMGIRDRFFLTIEGNNVLLEDLRAVLEVIRVETIPDK